MIEVHLRKTAGESVLKSQLWEDWDGWRVVLEVRIPQEDIIAMAAHSPDLLRKALKSAILAGFTKKLKTDDTDNSLTAAASELLWACRLVERHFTEVWGVDSNEAYEAVKAAIKKAEAI